MVRFFSIQYKIPNFEPHLQCTVPPLFAAKEWDYFYPFKHLFHFCVRDSRRQHLFKAKEHEELVTFLPRWSLKVPNIKGQNGERDPNIVQAGTAPCVGLLSCRVPSRTWPLHALLFSVTKMHVYDGNLSYSHQIPSPWQLPALLNTFTITILPESKLK